MTVKELIIELQKHPEDSEVTVNYNCGGEYDEEVSRKLDAVDIYHKTIYMTLGDRI